VGVDPHHKIDDLAEYDPDSGLLYNNFNYLINIRLPRKPVSRRLGQTMGRVIALSWSGWYGLFTPRGTPKEVIDKLNAATVEALPDPAVRSRLADLGLGLFPPEQQTPDALGALVNAAAREMVAAYKGD